MKVCQSSASAPGKTQSACGQCSKVFPTSVSSARHQLRDHQDTWAVIDMIQAGLTEEEAGRLYTKSIKQGVKTFGSYYRRTKVRQRRMKQEKNEDIKMKKLESTDGDEGDASWIVDDNINYDSDSDEKQDQEEDKRSSQERQ